MDIMHLIAAAAQQQATLSGTPSGPESYYSYDTGTENDDWEVGINGGTATFNAGNISLYVNVAVPGASADLSVTTASKIDVTDFDNITVNVLHSDPSSTLYVILGDTKTDPYSSYDYRQQGTYSSSSQDIVLDTSSISGEYYIRIHHFRSSKGSSTSYVYSVYLEIT